MRSLISWLWVAGAMQLLILAANFALPQKLRCRENLAHFSPMIRAVFVVHWLYMALKSACKPKGTPLRVS